MAAVGPLVRCGAAAVSMRATIVIARRTSFILVGTSRGFRFADEYIVPTLARWTSCPARFERCSGDHRKQRVALPASQRAATKGERKRDDRPLEAIPLPT